MSMIVADVNDEGSNPNQISFHLGIYIENNADIYVADYYNNPVQMRRQGATTRITVTGENRGGSILKQFQVQLMNKRLYMSLIHLIIVYKNGLLMHQAILH
jgi:hypothetical protein